MSRQVRLTLSRPRFVTNDSDADGPAPGKSLVLPLDTLQKALALAEARGFRAPKNQFFPSQTAEFARALRAALDEEVLVTTSPRASARFSTFGSLRRFFEHREQARYVTKLLALIEAGGMLDVTDG